MDTRKRNTAYRLTGCVCDLVFDGSPATQTGLVHDRSGRGNHATITGSGCLTFDGVNDVISFTLEWDGPEISTMWFSVWFNSTLTSKSKPVALAGYWSSLYSGVGGVHYDAFTVMANGAELCFGAEHNVGVSTEDTGVVHTGFSLPTGRWTHLVVFADFPNRHFVAWSDGNKVVDLVLPPATPCPSKMIRLLDECSILLGSSASYSGLACFDGEMMYALAGTTISDAQARKLYDRPLSYQDAWFIDTNPLAVMPFCNNDGAYGLGWTGAPLTNAYNPNNIDMDGPSWANDGLGQSGYSPVLYVGNNLSGLQKYRLVGDAALLYYAPPTASTYLLWFKSTATNMWCWGVATPVQAASWDYDTGTYADAGVMTGALTVLGRTWENSHNLSGGVPHVYQGSADCFDNGGLYMSPGMYVRFNGVGGNGKPTDLAFTGDFTLLVWVSDVRLAPTRDIVFYDCQGGANNTVNSGISVYQRGSDLNYVHRTFAATGTKTPGSSRYVLLVLQRLNTQVELIVNGVASALQPCGAGTVTLSCAVTLGQQSESSSASPRQDSTYVMHRFLAFNRALSLAESETFRTRGPFGR